MISLLGAPINRSILRDVWAGVPAAQSTLHPDWTILTYHDGPNGSIWLDANIVIAWSAIPALGLSVKEVVAQYGIPDKVLLRISRTTAGYSSTYLSYPCQGFVFEILEASRVFTPDTRVDTVWKIAPGYFDEVMDELRAFASLNGNEYEVITWPGFSATALP